MEEYERDKLLDCIYNIMDKLESLRTEFSRENPHKEYVSEKVKPILNDINVILSWCKEGEE